MVVVVDVPEDVLEIRAQVRSMDTSMQGERSEEGLVIAEGALEVPRALHVVVDIGLEGCLGLGPLHSTRFQKPPQDPMEPTSCNVLAWQSSAVACIS